MAETTRFRIRKVLHGELPEDRLPVIEWAPWWDQTVSRWHGEGVAGDLDGVALKRYFGLDIDEQYWFPQTVSPFPFAPPPHGQGLVHTARDYDAIRPYLYPRPLPIDRAYWQRVAAEQEAGDTVAWITMTGFFWWPRTLFGIEDHLYAFYDEPELLQRICADQTAYLLDTLDAFCAICVPEFMTFAEDMSYNHGPMISQEIFETFLAPCYRQVIPRLQAYGISVLIDSDGDVEPMIPWLEAVGVEGIVPLERMAGVDVARIRANHPRWNMVGGFDKTVMHRGEAAMRAEFARLLPTMRGGRYILGVDHQTPPEVSLADYQLYLRLLREYAAIAVSER